MSDNPLNAQQLQAIRNEAAAAVQAAVDKMQLRKWAVEQAFSTVTAFAELKTALAHDHSITVNYDPMATATQIYDFVSQAAVVKVDINPDKPF